MYEGRRRKKIRLEGYDYSSQGYYFITICTRDRENFFGNIVNSKMILNELGQIVYDEVIATNDIRKDIEIDEFIIMPNHIHLILIIVECKSGSKNNVGFDCIEPIKSQNVNNSSHMNNLQNMNNLQSGTMQSFPTVSRVIRGLKGSITSKINKIPEIRQGFAWQKSFFDKIIRNDDQLNKTRQYIIDNPMKWELDVNNPINIKTGQ